MKKIEELGISPTPWHIGKRSLTAYDVYGGMVAMVQTSSMDANLISASPRLYEALQSLVEYIDYECVPCGENACELMDKAHKVLAEAAGESEVVNEKI